MNTLDIVWFAVVHALALLGLVLSCGYALRWLERKRKKALLEIMCAATPVLAPGPFDGDVTILMVHGVVTIAVEASTVANPDGERDVMEICVTEWNARRILTELSKTLNLPLTRLAKKRIKAGLSSGPRSIVTVNETSGPVVVGDETR